MPGSLEGRYTGGERSRGGRGEGRTLFTAAKWWAQPSVPQPVTGDRMWSRQTVEQHSDIRNEVLTQATAWVNLET